MKINYNKLLKRILGIFVLFLVLSTLTIIFGYLSNVNIVDYYFKIMGITIVIIVLGIILSILFSKLIKFLLWCFIDKY